MTAKTKKVIRRRALQLKQNDAHPLYLFSLTGNELLEIADISRISRTNAGKLMGYQRPAVKHHIKDIVEYLNSSDVIFPNSIILSLSSRVKFIGSRGPQVTDSLVTAGILEIPVPRPSEQKPGWIVDGQQRATAISMSKHQGLPVPVNAFIADDVSLQRDQFLRLNNTKPLPRGLITELLPEVSASLPAKLAARKIPSMLCNLLNTKKGSPFVGLIRRASTSGPAKAKAIIADRSIVHMLEESLNSPSGCLFPYRNIATGETDIDGIWKVLVTYWTAVKNTFPGAWGKPPTKSRLMHGAGLRGMGRLMDRVMAPIDLDAKHALKHVEQHLRKIAPHCHWTSGSWEGLGGIEWNEIQNVPRHISMLSNFLVRTYMEVGTVAL